MYGLNLDLRSVGFLGDWMHLLFTVQSVSYGVSSDPIASPE